MFRAQQRLFGKERNVAYYRNVFLLFNALLLISAAESVRGVGVRKREYSDNDNECQWKVHVDTVLAFHNDHVVHTRNRTNQACLDECLNSLHRFGFECKSFEHVPMARYDCVLSKSTYSSSVQLYGREEMLQTVSGAIYTEKVCGTPTGRANDGSRTAGQFCEPGWQYVGNSCFRIVHATQSWNESSASCQQYGAQLASIHSKVEEDHLVEFMSMTGAQQIWIGLINPSGDNLEWTDGTAVDYTSSYNQSYDDARGPEEICVRQMWNFYGQTGWFDAACGQRYCYICRKER